MIFETIVTTRSNDGIIHIAPMGIREEDNLVILAPFKPSTTFDNVIASGFAVQNFCADVRIFAGCVTGAKRDWPTLPATKVAGVRLRDTLGHSELMLERCDDDAQRPKLFCRRVHNEHHQPFRGFNRAQAAVIEGAVLISRLHLLPAEKIAGEWQYLTIAIEKTAGPVELEAWSWLQARLDAHRKAMTS